MLHSFRSLFCLFNQRPLRVLLFAGLSIGCALPGAAASVYWDGGAGTSAWTDANNWSTNQLPTNTDDVILDNTSLAGSYAVVLDGLGQQARSLQVGYTGNPNTITLTITGGGLGDNLRLGGAPGDDLLIAAGGRVDNQSAASANGNRGIEFVSATDTWVMTGNGTYLHSQSNGSGVNVALGNATFSATSVFDVRAGMTTTYGGSTGMLTTIKRYGNLTLQSVGGTLNMDVALNTTDSVLIAGDVLISGTTTIVINNTNSGRLKVRVGGNLTLDNSQLTVAAGNGNDLLAVAGDVTTTGAGGQIAAASSAGKRGNLVIGGDLVGRFVGASNNEALVFDDLGGSGASLFSPEAGSVFRALTIYKHVVLGASVTTATASNTLLVVNGATLDFNGFQITGSGKFTAQDGSVLRITSPAGINATGATGNVVSSGTRSFGSAVTYWYCGTVAQVTGTGIPTASSDKVIISDNPTTLTLSKSVVVGAGGRLEIRQGTFIETMAPFEVSGTGILQMTGGTYRIVRVGTAALPLLDTDDGGVNQLSGGTIELVGAGNQVLRGNRSYVSLVFGGSGTKSLNTSIALPGESVTGAVAVTGTATFDQGINAFEGPASLTMTSGRFRTAATGLQPGLTGAYAITGGTVEFGNNNSPAQDIRSRAYHNIEVAGSNVIIQDGNIAISAGASLRILNTGALEITESRIVTGAGDFLMNAGGTLYYDNPQGITLAGLAGSVQVTGSRTFPASCSYGFRGSLSQVAGNGLPSQMVNLLLDKASGSSVVTMSQNVQVNGKLTLALGRLALLNTDLVINPTGAILEGGGPDAFIQTANSPTATGSLVLRVPNTGTPVLFPIGTGSYSPVTLTQPISASAIDFRIRVFEGVYTEGTYGIQAHTDVVNRTWMVEKQNAGLANTTMTVQWNAADELTEFTRATSRIKHYHGGYYDATMPLTAASGSNPYTLTRSSLSNFSPFVVGDGEAVLPVELTRFDVKARPEAVHLTWATASEQDNDYFEVQRATSADAAAFVTIGKVAGHGTTRLVNEYAWTDSRLPKAALVYYRLRQVDTDGTAHLSDVKVVKRTEQPDQPLSLYPNPVAEVLTIRVPAVGGTMLVHDALGREVRRQQLEATEAAGYATLDVRTLPEGVYTLLLVRADGSREAQRFSRTTK